MQVMRSCASMPVYDHLKHIMNLNSNRQAFAGLCRLIMCRKHTCAGNTSMHFFYASPKVCATNIACLKQFVLVLAAGQEHAI